VATPILFLLGPSGVGKSTLAEWIRDDLTFLHIEIDRFPDGDGVDLEGLRTEWEAFWSRCDARPIAAAINDRARASGRSGAVLSFPSLVVLSPQHIQAAQHSGIRIIVLYGSGAECLESFLRREEQSGRRLTGEHWVQNNALSYARFSLPDYAACRVGVFAEGRFRDRGSLVAEMRQRAV
jgi:hypothetical protein